MVKRKIKTEVFPHQIAHNVLAKCGEPAERGNTTEEEKLRNETRKILADENIVISSTCVRVPVFRAHSIAATLELSREFNIDDIRKLIEDTPFLTLEDKLKSDVYPMPINYSNKTDVGVGRIRKAEIFENGLSLWIVGDQLLRGAAYNALRIAEELYR